MTEEKKKSKSKYQRKIRRKRGICTVDPKWMWWLETPGKPRKR